MGLPVSPSQITAKIFSTATDGKISSEIVFKLNTPFIRLIGTEVSGKDMRIVEDAGLALVQVNIGTEAVPVFSTLFSINLTSGEHQITGDMIPSADALRDLGTASLKWKDLHLSGELKSGAVPGSLLTSLATTPAGSGRFPKANVPSDTIYSVDAPGGELGATYGAPTVDATHSGSAHHAQSHDVPSHTGTPGGELGGTWTSPTVDAAHSGSVHHVEDHQGRHVDGGADELSGLIGTGVIVPLGRMQRTETFGSNTGTVTVLSSETDIRALSVGTVQAGDRILVTATATFEKGGTGGDSSFILRQSLGTATIVVHATRDRIVHQDDQPASSTHAYTLSGIIRVTGTGTLTLKISGISAGSNATITTFNGQLYILVLNNG